MFMLALLCCAQPQPAPVPVVPSSWAFLPAIGEVITGNPSVLVVQSSNTTLPTALNPWQGAASSNGWALTSHLVEPLRITYTFDKPQERLVLAAVPHRQQLIISATRWSKP